MVREDPKKSLSGRDQQFLRLCKSDITRLQSNLQILEAEYSSYDKNKLWSLEQRSLLYLDNPKLSAPPTEVSRILILVSFVHMFISCVQQHHRTGNMDEYWIGLLKAVTNLDMCLLQFLSIT